ncbi:MAG: hypothetical protein FWE00_06075 [Defluviitaleaceae bacterium]|nr:hypothetical protein [Defluviitaleaceae bacterium]
MNRKIRPHSDIDISIFDEDRKSIIKFMLSKGWNVYEHKAEWINNKKGYSYLRPVLTTDDANITHLHSVWAIKPDCSFFKIEQKPGEESIYHYEILNKEQMHFDFLEIIFNKRQDGLFVCNKDKNISREIDKAILFNEGIPYLAPELMLFIISNPVYIESEFHREKNHIDFNSAAPFLPAENKDWLINALETAYPEGNKRIGELKAM